MSFGTRLRLVSGIAAAIVAAQILVSVPTRAQSADDSSVADAAKQARERKKDAASAKKVISDDDLSTTNMKPGDEGLKVGAAPTLQTGAPSAALVAADEAADKKAATSPADDPLKSTDPAKVAALKEELAQAEEDLKLSQRESALQQDTYYSNPDYKHDDAGKAKLEDMQQQISNNRQKVEDLKARLAAMQEALSKQGAAAPEAEKTATPPQP